MNSDSFRLLIRRVRAGDAEAAEQLHQKYGEQLQRIVRVRLTNPELRRQMDSQDICQSVFFDFFVRMAVGQFEINEPADLIKLLATMAQNRVIHHAKKQKAARRDVRRNTAAAPEDMVLPGADETPSQIVASRELIEQFFGRLDDEGRAIAEWRRADWTWEEIGAELNRSGEAVRKRHERTIRRISSELGLELLG